MQPKIGLTFASALRAFLRQDPDVVMVGEIRDKETVDIAINASLTGHLVLSTIHTNDAAGAITRMIDMGVEPFLIRSSVIGILAQRLVRVLCPHCKEPYPARGLRSSRSSASRRSASRGARAAATARHALLPARRRRARRARVVRPGHAPDVLQARKGCDKCAQHRASSGRRGIYELLLIDDVVGPLVLKTPTRRPSSAPRRTWAWTRCATTARARCSRA